jgi:hypothetical protein
VYKKEYSGTFKPQRINYLNAQRGKKFSDGTYVYQVLGQFNNDILSSVGVPLVDKEVQDNAFEVVGKTNMEYYDNQGALHIRDFTFANNTGTSPPEHHLL